MGKVNKHKKRRQNVIQLSAEVRDELYYIELTDRPGVFMHPNRRFGKQEGYVAKTGCIGAALWKKEQAENILQMAETENLKMVPFNEVMARK